MKFVVQVAGLLLTEILTVTSAMASGPYIGATGGGAFFHDSDQSSQWLGDSAVSFDPSYAFQLGAGYNFGDRVRLEGEFGYKKADRSYPKAVLVTNFYDNGVGYTSDFSVHDLTVMSFMLNGFYDIRTSLPVTPFVGGGIGALRGKLRDYRGGAYDTVFGYQLSAGASYGITKAVDLSLSYRFEGAAHDFSFAGTDFSYHSSNVLAGVRYTFR